MRFIFGLSILLLNAIPAAAIEQNTIWVMWERVLGTPALCDGEDCAPQSEFRSHFLEGLPQAEARALFDDWTPLARLTGAADIAHSTMPACTAEEEPEIFTLAESERALVEKIETLRGLEGIFADFRGARGPSWMRENFGETVDLFMRKALAKAGIPLLTREQMEETPGRPQLTVRFSPEVQGCRPWSVSLSVKQTMVLTRDTRMMLEGTTWSASQRQSEEDVDFGPLDAAETAILAFVEAYRQANTAAPSEETVAQQ
ncbi:MAG: hypothetical protein AAGD04_15755 [Pseudomonadota bacterium]